MYCFNQVDFRCPPNLWGAIFILLTLGCSAQEKPSQPNLAPNRNPSPANSDTEKSGQKNDPQESQSPDKASSQSAIPANGQVPFADPNSTTVLSFDGTSLTDWEITPFGGEGECKVENGAIVLEPGFPLTGITSTRNDLPKMNYEILLEARKTSGIDFFVGLTFPVDESHCSLIVGGWAGPVVGLSVLDGQDASNNETKRLMKFELNRWYQIKLQVTPNRIVAWIDDKQVINQDVTGRQLSVRNETLKSRPLGLCCFETRAEIRKFELKSLAPRVTAETRESPDSE